MPANDYHFISHWTAPGATCDEVFAVISDVEALPQWWPSVYLRVTPLARTAEAIGQEYDMYTKGWLPYTLRWRMTIATVTPPHVSRILASGDFVGRGIWTFTQTEEGVDITFDWKLQAEKPMLKWLSPLLKPAFAANHAWAMQQGQISLLRELARRRQQETMPPPGATTWQPYAILSTLLFGTGVIGWLLAKRAYKRSPESEYPTH
jgi:uncharacterized protein YndB with AHSA1/START domain